MPAVASEQRFGPGRLKGYPREPLGRFYSGQTLSTRDTVSQPEDEASGGGFGCHDIVDVSRDTALRHPGKLTKQRQLGRPETPYHGGETRPRLKAAMGNFLPLSLGEEAGRF